MKLNAVLAPVVLAASLSACSLGGMLGGGKAPPYMLTLTPEAPDPGPIVRTANAGEAVTISVPHVAKEIHSVRIPVQVTPSNMSPSFNISTRRIGCSRHWWRRRFAGRPIASCSTPPRPRWTRDWS